MTLIIIILSWMNLTGPRELRYYVTADAAEAAEYAAILRGRYPRYKVDVLKTDKFNNAKEVFEHLQRVKPEARILWAGPREGLETRDCRR